MSEKDLSKLLSGREIGPLRRCGITTIDELVDSVRKFGLLKISDSKFLFGREGPDIRMAGRKLWAKYLSVMDSENFDWRKYVIKRYSAETEFELRYSIEKRIDDLIELLKKYKEFNQPNNGVQPTADNEEGIDNDAA